MPKRDPKVRLLHMRDYARQAIEMAKGQTRADLDSDDKLRWTTIKESLPLLVQALDNILDHCCPKQATFSALPFAEGVQTMLSSKACLLS